MAERYRPALDADGLRCYKAKAEDVVPAVPDVQLTDQFENRFTEVVSSICNLARAAYGDIEHKGRLLLCFKLKDAETDPKQDKFVKTDVSATLPCGTEQLQRVEAGWLCVTRRARMSLVFCARITFGVIGEHKCRA